MICICIYIYIYTSIIITMIIISLVVIRYIMMIVLITERQLIAYDNSYNHKFGKDTINTIDNIKYMNIKWES